MGTVQKYISITVESSIVQRCSGPSQYLYIVANDIPFAVGVSLLPI